MSFADNPLHQVNTYSPFIKISYLIECFASIQAADASHTSTESEGPLDTVLVSDSSPSPQTIKHTPTDTEIALSKVLREQDHTQQPNCIPPFPRNQFDMLEQILMAAPNVYDLLHHYYSPLSLSIFTYLHHVTRMEHYTDCGFLITNTFLLDLATPQIWVSTLVHNLTNH